MKGFGQMARPVKDEALRGRLIVAAAHVIAARGHNALSAREIAVACNISPGTIYNYFENIEEIVQGVRKQVLDDLVASLRAVEFGLAPSVQGLARRYLVFAMDRPHLWAMVTALQLPAERPRSRGHVQPQRELELLFRSAVASVARHHSEPAVRKISRSLATFVHAQAAVYTHPKMRPVGDHGVHDISHDAVEQITRGLARSVAKAPARRRKTATPKKRGVKQKS